MGGRKGQNQRNNKQPAKAKKNNNKVQTSRLARPNLIGSVQWALAFVMQMLSFPLKGAANVALTVDDFITALTSQHNFVSDPNLAIDTFREVKETMKKKGATDGHGRSLTFEKFKEFLSAHPTLRRLKLRHDKKLTSALFGKHSSSKVDKAAKAAFEAGQKAYQTLFVKWLTETQETSVKAFAAFSEPVQQALFKSFNPAYQPNASFALWHGENLKLGKKDIRKGDILSKTAFTKAFEKTYKLEGKNAPSKAYRLKGTVKVRPEMIAYVDGCNSYRKTTGDPVSVFVDWTVVVTPSHGEGEFYLNRIMHIGDDVVNPAYGHLLQDSKVLSRWKNAGMFALGWLPNPQLAAAYGCPTAEKVLTDYTLCEGDMVATMTNGGTLAFANGHWTLNEPTVTEKKQKKLKKASIKASRNGNNDDDPEPQPITAA